MTAVTDAPRRSDAQRNHERIIAAAIEVFAEKGPNASVPDVASRAGVGKATVYRNYPTKDDLLTAVVNDRLEWLVARGERAAAEPDAWAALRSYIDDVVTHVMVDRALCEVLRNDRTPSGEALRTRKNAYMEAILAKGRTQGTIRDDATPDDVRIILGGLSDQLQREGEKDVEVWRRYARFVLDALRAAA